MKIVKLALAAVLALSGTCAMAKDKNPNFSLPSAQQIAEIYPLSVAYRRTITPISEHLQHGSFINRFQVGDKNYEIHLTNTDVKKPEVTVEKNNGMMKIKFELPYEKIYFLNMYSFNLHVIYINAVGAIAPEHPQDPHLKAVNQQMMSLIGQVGQQAKSDIEEYKKEDQKTSQDEDSDIANLY